MLCRWSSQTLFAMPQLAALTTGTRPQFPQLAQFPDGRSTTSTTVECLRHALAIFYYSHLAATGLPQPWALLTASCEYVATVLLTMLVLMLEGDRAIRTAQFGAQFFIRRNRSDGAAASRRVGAGASPATNSKNARAPCRRRRPYVDHHLRRALRVGALEPRPGGDGARMKATRRVLVAVRIVLLIWFVACGGRR